MATQTFQHSSFGSGIVRVEFDINPANWRMSQVRCINNSSYAAKATILESGVQIFTATAQANQTTNWNVTGIQMGWDSVDGGLMMGNYEIHAGWPSGEG